MTTEKQIFACLTTGAEVDFPLEGPAWIAWRRLGRQIGAGWYQAGNLNEAVRRARLDGFHQEADTAELCLTSDYREVDEARIQRVFANAGRGVKGLEITSSRGVMRIAPTRSIATNRALIREIEGEAVQSGLSVREFLGAARFRSFAARQFLVGEGLPGGCVALWRGGRVVSPEDVGPEMLEETIAGLTGWMRRNLQPDGRMVYKYWPSRGRESLANNTVRQFMATVALGRIAARSGEREDAEAASRNLCLSLATFYAEIDGFGAILFEGKAKLGAAALAALAILEFREAGLIAEDAFQVEFSGLCRGIDKLWQADGSFRTFLQPADRNDNQNFYPGEALLFLVSLHRKSRDPALAGRCIASFRWYREWHLARPNPAFIPWHSQACMILYEDLDLPELAEFIFDRNDWLLSMQQWGAGLHPDLQGRFYDPARPEYGPPHASSTGVYMEGLADAWRLARRLGDSARAARYAQVLQRGLRAIRQLQFRDRRVDAFYISQPELVMGGLRTEVYNNEIRVDNVQHCLMALLKLEGEDALFAAPEPQPWPGMGG